MVSSLETISAGFLIAAPSLADPNFDHAVVLMCMHNDQGAMGLVINRAAPVTTADLMHHIGIECASEQPRVVLLGGPVALESGVLLYQADAQSSPRDDEIVVTDELRLCPSQDILRDIATGDGPDSFHIVLGHAGWAPGQIEQEIAQGAWIPAQLRLDLIFETPLQERWENALVHEGFHPSTLGSFRPQS